MVNWIWGGLMVASILCGIATGRVGDVSNAVIDGSTQAIDLCLTMVSMMVLWSGLVAIMQRSGLSDLFGRLLSPLIGLLFPELRHHPKARNAIGLNVAANVLGLGNAATPLGLKAMAELQTINQNSAKASNSMITFVVLNSVSIQLIPTGLAVLRAKYHSADPMSVLTSVWFVSVAAAVLGMSLTLLFNKRRNRRV